MRVLNLAGTVSTRHKMALGAVLLAAIQLAGCGGNNAGNNQTQGTNSTEVTANSDFKVALLTPGNINDQGWNQLAGDGLEGIKKELGVQTSHEWTKSASEHQPALRDFADQGYNLILCHGFEYGQRVKAIAPNYKNTKFVVVAGDVKQEPNVATIVPKLEEATYLLGMVAGGMTKTNTIGAIGGIRLPVIKSTFDAFEQGAKAVNPKVRVLTSYVGSFDDQNKGKEAAKSMIAQNADILFHNADQSGKGMFNAAQEAKGKVWVFGSNRNQNEMAPDVCLGSAIIDMPHAFKEVVQDVQNEKFKAEFRELNIPNGNIAVAWNEKLMDKIPPMLMKKVAEAQEKIKSGQLKIKRNV